MFSGPPIVQFNIVTVSWTTVVVPLRRLAPPVTGIRYALYSQCGAETAFSLIDDDIQGLSFNITTLPSLTQCVLRVVVYSDHCLLDVNGPLGATTDNFTTGEVVYVTQNSTPHLQLQNVNDMSSIILICTLSQWFILKTLSNFAIAMKLSEALSVGDADIHLDCCIIVYTFP